MCEWGSTTTIRVIRRNNPDVPDGWHEIGVDSCIAEYVQEMNELGIITLACCCGHGKVDYREVLVSPESAEKMTKLGYVFEDYEGHSLLHRW